MGEEEKKPEESKAEEKKPEEQKEEKNEAKEEEEEGKKAGEEKKAEESKDAKEEAPAEIVLKVFMHCEGCARKVRRSLKAFPGVEDVITDCKSHKVVVKGEKADPLKVLERVQRKSHRQVELLSPIPKPPHEEDKNPQDQGKDKPKPEDKKPEPQVITVVLNVHMHCEACSQEIKRRIERMQGVESVEPDLKNSQVSVKGVFEAAKLVEYVRKRTGKQAVIVKQEPEKKEEAKEEKKAEEGGGDKDQKASGDGGEDNKDKKEGEGEAKPAEAATEETKVVELKRNEYYYNPPRYGMEFYAYPGSSYSYPPQIFSDENPNACTVM